MQTEERKAEYRGTPEFKARHREYMRRYRREHPEIVRRAGKACYDRNAIRYRAEARAKARNLSPEQKERFRKLAQIRHLRRKYNLTPEAKELMYKNQRGRCYLCTRPLSSCLEAVVDHSHYTNDVRGLAHSRCNIRLGQIEKAWHEDPTTITRMLNVAGAKQE